MRTARRSDDVDGFSAIDSADTQVLTAREERQLLQDLGDCREKLTEALKQTKNFDFPLEDADSQTLARQIAAFYAGDGLSEARLGAIFHRYSELRGKLAFRQESHDGNAPGTVLPSRSFSVAGRKCK